jgi:hypothetical protein
MTLTRQSFPPTPSARPSLDMNIRRQASSPGLRPRRRLRPHAPTRVHRAAGQ